MQHLAALLNRGLSDGLRQVALPSSARAEKNNASSRLLMKAPVARSKTKTAIHLGIEAEVEVVERPVGIAESGLFATAFQQPGRIGA